MEREIHFGTVTRITDDTLKTKLRGAVFFESATISGKSIEYPIPAEPTFPFASVNSGFFWVPTPGDLIEIEITPAEVMNPNPRYRRAVYNDEDELAREFRKNYPFRMGFKTKTGHVLIWDDTDGEEEMFLEHKFGTRIMFEKDGKMSIKARKRTATDKDDESKDTFDSVFQEIVLDFAGKEIKIHDQFGNTAKLNTTGINLKEKSGGQLNLANNKVALGGTTFELMGLLIRLINAIITETHPTLVGPTGVPLNVAIYTKILADLQIIKGSLL